jgi:hypothetical protein
MGAFSMDGGPRQIRGAKIVIALRDYISKRSFQSIATRRIIRVAGFELYKGSKIAFDCEGCADEPMIAEIVASLIIEYGADRVRSSVSFFNAKVNSKLVFDLANNYRNESFMMQNTCGDDEIKELNMIYLVMLRKFLREDNDRAKVLMDVRDDQLVSFVKSMSLVDIMTIANSGVICYAPRFNLTSISAMDNQPGSFDGLDAMLMLMNSQSKTRPIHG